MKKNFLMFVIVALVSIPALSSAQVPGYQNMVGGQNNINAQQNAVPQQSTNKITNINSLADRFVNIGNLFIYLLIAFAVIFITWNAVRYLVIGGEDGRKKAAASITLGIVGLFIILSIWGLVNILIGTFGTNNNAPTDRIPNANFLNNR